MRLQSINLALVTVFLCSNLDAKPKASIPKALNPIEDWIKTNIVGEKSPKNPLLRFSGECIEFSTLSRDEIRAVDNIVSVISLEATPPKIIDPSVTCTVTHEFEDAAPFTKKLEAAHGPLNIELFKKVDVLGEKNIDAKNYALVLSAQNNPQDKLNLHCRITGKKVSKVTADSLVPYLAQALGCEKAEYDYKIFVGEPIFEKSETERNSH